MTFPSFKINVDLSPAGLLRATRDFIYHEALIFLTAGATAVSNDTGYTHVAAAAVHYGIVSASLVAFLVHLRQWTRTTQATVDSRLSAEAPSVLPPPASTEFVGTDAPAA